MVTARLLTLSCTQTEDWTGADEVLMKVYGNRYSEYSRPLHNGEIWNINIDIEFTNRVRIEVWEKDIGSWPDPDDLLGVYYINCLQLRLGVRETVFNGSGAIYTLTYEACPECTT
jgi:hypothetical protein